MQVTDRRLIALLPRNPRLIRIIFRVPKSIVVIYLEFVDLALGPVSFGGTALPCSPIDS
jgi:hypothetical protein